jgi:hypothetical protein
VTAIKNTVKSGPNVLIAEADNSNNERINKILDGDTGSKHFNKGAACKVSLKKGITKLSPVFISPRKTANKTK